jgi:hypothetical protein
MVVLQMVCESRLLSEAWRIEGLSEVRAGLLIRFG